MVNGGNMKKHATTGALVNKLENAIAVAMMRGDKVAEQKFTKVLEMAVNSTDFPKVSA
jgi:hypothetical protein